ncbi:hypothetical protein D3C86_1416500 [compost metagenome]
MAHGQQGDFVVEIDEAFDDHPTFTGTATFLGVVPGFLHVIDAAQQALALARGTHDRLDHARETEVFNGFAVVLEGVGEVVRRGRQVQLFSGQATDAFAVHGQLRGAGGRDHGEAFGLQFHQGRGGDGFDFRDDEVRLLGFDHGTQGSTIEHVDHVAAVRHLHGRRVGVAVHGNHFNAQALQLDHHFLAQLATATHQYAGRGRRQWGSDTGHLKVLKERIIEGSTLPMGRKRGILHELQLTTACLRRRQAMISHTAVTPANFEPRAVRITPGVSASIMPKKIKVSRGMLRAELIHRRSCSGRLVMLNTSQSMHSETANAVALARAMDGSEVT